MTTLTAVLTTFNRCALTLACLEHLAVAAARAQVELGLVMVDDGSSDDTVRAVRSRFPAAHIEVAGGDLYWCRGMHRAMALAMQRQSDFLLWLNDDTVLHPDALTRLLQEAAMLRVRTGREVLLAGATADRQGHLSYGGSVAASRWRRFSYRKVWSASQPVPCEVVNGNCVLLPMALTQCVGNLDPAYEHAMGDTDYALRAGAAGFGVFVASGYVGECNRNASAGTFEDALLPWRQRWHSMMGRKGLPMKSWAHFTRRHGGPLWPLYFIWPYLRLVSSGLRLPRPS